MVDIDGGIGTVFSYRQQGHPRAAQRHRRTSTAGSSGSAASGTFLGQHVYTSRPGVAVQINAFNFPVWGMLEKLAPAFLAGLPTIVKPASQTAYLTELVVRRILESGHPARGRAAAAVRQRRPACSTSSARRTRWRSPVRRTPPAHPAAAPVGAPRRRPARRRGRLAELLDPRPRRHARATRSSTCSSRASSPR